ncbi:hypothetical protein QN354_08410 [Cryobacterium sp. 5I3]|uniref:DUF7657 domain-containing protein n=1 Tax=Cryobacterium sp. 5I3 TaxID=3048592 RepID=UPI002B23C623|nr:hypothetical protein [Cryobacterium sp. 5I3]MEB0201778.1 hypothetical protein [Cryobacterium sp. 5I3]
MSQVQHGFPVLNPMFPGGTDMTVLNELPTWDWSTVFRPHLWGYLFFGLDTGAAWQWWIPALALVVSCYLFIVSMIPRRPVTAAALAVATLYTPMLQWFYTPSSLWPVAWALLAMAGTVWVLTDRRRWVRYSWAGVVGYAAVTMGMGLYVPFMLPGLFVFAAFFVGYVLRTWTRQHLNVRLVVTRAAPLICAGLAGLLVLTAFVATRIDTFRAILSTVYPGQRSQQTGQLLAHDPFLAGIAGGPWNESLRVLGSSILGGNASEGSSVILLSVFLLPGLIWFAIRSLSRQRETDWLALCILACFLSVLAFLLIPGWDWAAKLLFFDRVPTERFRIAFIVFLPVFVALVVENVDRGGALRKWFIGAICAVMTAGIFVVQWRVLKTEDPAVLFAATHWKLIVVLLLATTFLFFVRRGAAVAAISLLVATLLIGGGVNPLYRGVFDLNQTAIGATVHDIDAKGVGTWIGVGTYETMAVLVETGVPSLSGIQTYPSKAMWSEIDPSAHFEENWNRLGRVVWELRAGGVAVSNPYPDVIEVSIDPCSEFAQRNIKYVLTDRAETADSCLVPTAVVKQGNLTMRILTVVTE